jgi:diaminopimelate decarboxylase
VEINQCSSNGMLKIADIDVSELIKEYGAPLYVYDEKILEKRLELLSGSFKDFDIFYSFKSNPNPQVCSFIKHRGQNADTASIGEVRLAQSCGFNRHEIIYSAPGKKEAEIREAIGKCIIISDSLNELKMINEICGELGIREEVGIRINPNYSIEGSAALEVMSGYPSKFGIDQEILVKSIDFIKNLKNIEVKGIQIYMGSQIIDYNIIYSNFLNIFKVAGYCKNELGLDLEFIDFGGGFGIKYTDKDEELNIQKAGEMVGKLKNSNEFKSISNARLIIESGRFISGPAGYYIARVLDRKVSRGKNYAILDGGMNTFFRPVFIKENRYPIEVGNKMNLEKSKRITLGGVMCTPIDIYEEDVMLPEIERDDIIVFFNTGAYGYTMSLTKFISHEEVKEIYIAKDRNIIENK